MPVWTKPPGVPRINWNHPLAQYLVVCVVPEFGELLTGTPPAYDANGSISPGIVGYGALTNSGGGPGTGRVSYALPSWSKLYSLPADHSWFFYGAVSNITGNYSTPVGVLQAASGADPYYCWSPVFAYSSTDNGYAISTGGTNRFWYTGATGYIPLDGAVHALHGNNTAGNLDLYRDGTIFVSGASLGTTSAADFSNAQPLCLGEAASALTPTGVDQNVFLFYAFSRPLSATEHVLLAADPGMLLDYQDDFGETTWFLLTGGAPPFNPSTSLVAQAPQLPPVRRLWPQQQAAFAPPWPPDSRKVPWNGPYFPRPPVRPRMHASQQRASTLVINDARTVPWSASTAPNAVRRPGMLAAEQMAASPRELVSERPFPYFDGIEPEAARRVLAHARHQPAFADPTYGWSLVVAAPAITPPAWPDTVRRPGMLPTEQRADAPRVPLDRPFPQVDGSAPAKVRRPRMHASEQQALGAPPAPPDARTVPWSDATAPATVRRPTFAAALQQAWMDDTYARLLVIAPNITPPVWPDAVRRPSFAASQQRAFSITTTTDRPFPYADGIYPTWLPRLTPQQRPFTSIIQPEQKLPYFGATVPAAVRRPAYLAAEQLPAVSVGVPITPVPAPDLVALCYPASVSGVMRLIAPSAFMPPWRYSTPTPSLRVRGTPGDMILERGTAADTTGATGEPSDE